MIENYYAIRIGNPRRHIPYLWLGEDGSTPVLFATKEKATGELGGIDRASCARVVKVRVCYDAGGKP